MCLVVYNALEQESVDYRLLLVTVAKTAVTTAISYVMKRNKKAVPVS